IIKVECQVDKTEHFRQHLLFVFYRGIKTAEATRDLFAVNEDALPRSTALHAVAFRSPH
ncbi:hypothetical protein AVEN_95511-1, partial [Araneus ventricosus]